jgi:5-methylcytosine-specific restriction protein A
MSTYLLTWNPDQWPWDELDDEVRQLRRSGFFDGQWNFGTNYRRVALGERVFVMRQAVEPKGIIAAGEVTSEPREDVHFADKKKTAWYVDVRFDSLLPLGAILRLEAFGERTAAFLKSARASGTAIEAPHLERLESAWRSHLRSRARRENG